MNIVTEMIRRAEQEGAVKLTEITCNRCGTTDQTIMGMASPATMNRKFENLSVSIEMKCECGNVLELNYRQGEFKLVQNPLDCEDEWDEDELLDEPHKNYNDW